MKQPKILTSDSRFKTFWFLVSYLFLLRCSCTGSDPVRTEFCPGERMKHLLARRHAPLQVRTAKLTCQMHPQKPGALQLELKIKSLGKNQGQQSALEQKETQLQSSACCTLIFCFSPTVGNHFHKRVNMLTFVHRLGKALKTCSSCGGKICQALLPTSL